MKKGLPLPTKIPPRSSTNAMRFNGKKKLLFFFLIFGIFFSGFAFFPSPANAVTNVADLKWPCDPDLTDDLSCAPTSLLMTCLSNNQTKILQDPTGVADLCYGQYDHNEMDKAGVFASSIQSTLQETTNGTDLPCNKDPATCKLLYDCINSADTVNSPAAKLACYTQYNPTELPNAQAQVQATDLGPPEENKEVSTDCNIFNGWIGIAGCVTGFVYIFTVGLGSAMAFVGASFLNLAVHLSLNSSSYSLDFVSLGWTTARDIANMAFIFILVYLALVIMFQANTAHTMHTLAQVILVALFINFSFFLTRVVIDAGNILGVQFYNAIVANGKTEPVAGNTPLAAATNFSVDPAGDAGPKIYIPDLTASIMQGLDVQKAINSESFKKFAEDHNNFGGFVPYTIALSFLYISLGAMFFMLAAAFLTAGVKFLVRIVYLWFMIIAAPLALVARVSGLHMFDKYYFQWRNALLSHAIYPVAFLFVFWILSQFMVSLNASNYLAGIFAGLSQSDLTAGGADPVTGFVLWVGRFIANLGLRLGFVIALIYVAIRASETLSVYGSGFADKFGQRFSLGGLSGYRSRLPFLRNAVAAPAVLGASGLAYGGNALLRNSGLMLKNDPRGAAARKLGGGLQALSNASTGVLPSAAGIGKSLSGGGQDKKDREIIAKALANPTGLSDAEKARLNQVNVKNLGLMSAGDMEKLAAADLFSEKMLKKIHDSKDISDGNKHGTEHAAGHAADSRKMSEMLETLRTISQNTHGIMVSTDTGMQDLSVVLHSANELTKQGTTNIKNALNNKLDEIKTSQKVAESNLQGALDQRNRAQRAGGATAAHDAEVNRRSQEMTAVTTERRNTEEGLKAVEKK